MGIIKYIKSFYWTDIYDNPTLTPNSITPLPRYKFNQLARIIEPNEDDEEPNKTIWDFKKWFRKNNVDDIENYLISSGWF